MIAIIKNGLYAIATLSVSTRIAEPTTTIINIPKIPIMAGIRLNIKANIAFF